MSNRKNTEWVPQGDNRQHPLGAAEPEIGSHIYVPMFTKLMTHHGIYIGNGQVVAFSKTDKALKKMVKQVSLEEFSGGQPYSVVHYEDAAPPEVVVERALSQVGTADYHLIENNCEHFARWCKTGKKHSQQAERARQCTKRAAARVTLARTLPHIGTRLATRVACRATSSLGAALATEAAGLVVKQVTHACGADDETAELAGEVVSCAGAIGIGFACGGVVGAAVAFAFWGVSKMIS